MGWVVVDDRYLIFEFCYFLSAGQSVTVAIHPSNVVITKLKDDSNRNKLLTRRAAAKGKDGKAEKGAPAASAMSLVD